MRVPSVLILGGIAVALSGCVGDRLDHLGKPPSMSPMENPQDDPTYRSVSLPMPVQPSAQPQTASLWQSGARAFFKDQRASKVGDIMTVVINIDERRSSRTPPHVRATTARAPACLTSSAWSRRSAASCRTLSIPISSST